MIQQSKEKGKFYRSQQKKVLESVTDVNDIDAVIQQAEEAEDYAVPSILNLWVLLSFNFFLNLSVVNVLDIIRNLFWNFGSW